MQKTNEFKTLKRTKLCKNSRGGITLIALVITVIVLLILSGIALSMLTGENSILKRTTQAKKVTDEAEFQEQLKLAVMASWDTFGNLKAEILEQNIRNDISGVTVSSGGDNENDLLTASLKGMNYSIDSDGNVTKAGPKPIASGLTITKENGDAIPEDGVEAGTKLKINFSASIEGGTVTISPTVPHITTDAEVSAKKVVFTLTGTVDGETVTTTYTVDLKSSYEKSEMSIEDLKSTENAGKYWGWDVLNYKTKEGVNLGNIDWQVFYVGKIDDTDENEEDHIYLISKDYVENQYLPTVIKNGEEVSGAKPIATDGSDYKARFGSATWNDGVFPQYAGSSAITNAIAQKMNSKFFKYLTDNSRTSTMDNIKAVAYMQDTTTWSGFAGSYSDYAMGGPPVEMLFKAYNKNKKKASGETYETQVTSTYGYQISNDGGTSWGSGINWGKNYNSGMIKAPYVLSSNKADGYWLASPLTNNSSYGVASVMYSGGMAIGASFTTAYGFRPIVCLKSNYTLEKTKDSNNKDAFNIIEKSE